MSVMSATIHQGESTNELTHKFSTSWEIKNLKSLGKDSIKTLSFSPIPDLDTTFYFEFSYSEIVHNPNTGATCKLVLFWNSCIFYKIPNSMKMNLTVTFESTRGEVLRKCEQNNIIIDGKNSLVILNSLDYFYAFVYDSYDKRYNRRRNDKPDLKEHSPLIMKCNLIFYADLSNNYFRDKQIFKNLKDFVGDFGSIYHPSLLSDVEFKIGDELLPAHKCILAAHSPVFLRMLSGDFLESKTNIIPITDSTPEMFNFFLKYLYCGEMEDKTWPVVKELYLLADKYDVRTLRRNCEDLFTSILSVENICEILKLAYDFKIDDLKREAKNFAVKNFKELSASDNWTKLVQSHPFAIYEVMLSFVPNSD